MTRDEALAAIAELHYEWSVEHGDTVPYVGSDANPHDGQGSDLAVWQADRSAPADVDDPLNEAIKQILAQIDGETTNHLPGKHDQSSHGRKKGTVRKALAGATTIDELNAAASAEIKRITGGRDVEVDMAGSDLQIGKEHLEGVMLVLQRWPKAPLGFVGTYGRGSTVETSRFQSDTREVLAKHPNAWAVTATGPSSHVVRYPSGRAITPGSDIYFNNDQSSRWGVDTYRSDLRSSHNSGWMADGTIAGVGVHEMGHVVASFQRTMKAAGDVARARGQEAVRTLRAAHVRSYVTRELSQYATTNDAELSAESVSEVVMRGSKARPLARAVVKVIDEHHQEFAKDM